MGQPIQQGAGQPLRAQHFGPLGKGQVAGHQRRSPFVALAENFEQHFGTGLRQRHDASDTAAGASHLVLRSAHAPATPQWRSAREIPADKPPVPTPSRCGFSRSRSNPKHNAHSPEIVKIHYPFHPLCGQSLRVRRRATFPRGEYVYCELPDGTICGFPSWMADPVRGPSFTSGSPLASAAALADLWSLLHHLHSSSDRGNAAVRKVRSDDSNATKEDAGYTANESALL